MTVTPTFKPYRIETRETCAAGDPEKIAEAESLGITRVHLGIVRALGELGYICHVMEPTTAELVGIPERSPCQSWFVLEKSLDDAECLVMGTPLCREGLIEIKQTIPLNGACVLEVGFGICLFVLAGVL